MKNTSEQTGLLIIVCLTVGVILGTILTGMTLSLLPEKPTSKSVSSGENINLVCTCEVVKELEKE